MKRIISAMSDLTTLNGRHVSLEPLHEGHHDELVTAVQDGQLWRLWWARVPSPEMMCEEIRRRLDLQSQGTMEPYTVFAQDTDGARRAVGMTTLMTIDRVNRVAQVGSTWYAASCQGTAVNPESKLLLLSDAFDRQGFQRIELRTHSMNMHSRRAIEKLGATYEGTLRRHQIMLNGSVRDTVLYSILDYEWPAVRAGLEYRLERYA